MRSPREFLTVILTCMAIVFVGFAIMSPYAPPAMAAGVGPAQTPTNIQLSATTVTTAWTTIGATNQTVVRLAGRMPVVSVEITNTTDGNDSAITDFRLQYRTWPGGNWLTRYSGTDWSNASVLNGDDWSGTDDANSTYVNALGAADSCGLVLYLGPYDAIRFQAKTAATGTVAIRGLAK